MRPVLEVIGEAPTIETFTAFYSPVMTTTLVAFLAIFDFAPNFYAELSGFADRQFY